jgi:acetyl-CoA/propionyl-CoA carboxylase, biotin carboxylase, biotin carboxyl carrier protein
MAWACSHRHLTNLEKILIANRGEIAVRVARTAHEMGIACVAVYSEADREALHVRMADEAYLLGPAPPSQSYLNIDRVLDVAARSGAQAVHPGYGFLAENASFAQRVIGAGLIWVGPHARAIEEMGDKLRARRAMEAAGVPFVPGGTEPIPDVAAARRAAKRYGFPLALKAAGGGGGKGLKVASTLEEIDSAFTTATREAQAYFGNPVVYAERYLENPKHVELQIVADKHGNVLHAGERDCSLQRRHQKIWEETPPVISEAVRGALREAGIRAARAIAYDSVGTIEFLVSDNAFYFLEMNTRIQVEHTVTEMVCGIDLIREQIRVALGEPLGYGQERVSFRGTAIEGRVNAEDPAHDFRPVPGRIGAYREPSGPGVRVDSAAYPGARIGADYDSLVAKLVVWAPSREQSIARLRRAIDEFVIEGVPTTLPILRALCDEPHVRDGTYGTSTLELFAQRERERGARATLNGPAGALAPLYRVTPSTELRPAPRVPRARRARATESGDTVLSPMHGVVVEICVAAGDTVKPGQIVAVVEAMKMMNEIRAQRAGAVAAVHARAGATVEMDAPLVTLA